MLEVDLEERIHKAIHRAIEFEGICFRSVGQKYATKHNICSGKGSLLVGGRYNFIGAFEILYLACDPHTCLEETTHSMRRSGFDVAKRLPRTLIGLKVKLSKVLDLTDSDIQLFISITETDLTETDWESIQNLMHTEAITQSIGRFSKDAGFEAILVPSAAWNGGKNLDIFPDNLLPSSQVSVVNDDDLI